MVVVKFEEGCEAIIDEEVKEVRISDGRTVVVKLVFDEEWGLESVLANDVHVWTKEGGC